MSDINPKQIQAEVGVMPALPRLAALGSLILTVLLVAAFIGCSSFSKKPQKIDGPRVSIMVYNVENLFDTKHDEGTEDFTFLPLTAKKEENIKAGCAANSSDYRKKECLETDWSEEVLEKKMSRVAHVIRQVGEGRGPDILILAEVENQNVIDTLNKQHLRDSGYQTAKVIDSFDPRGIDPGILSRFPMWREPKIHRLPLKAETKEGEYAASRTRGILEVPITLPDGTKALVFGLHFPSQSNPTYLRKQAVEFLNEIEKGLPTDVVAIMGGDFNITSSEDKDFGYFSKTLNSVWQVSHLEGCKACDGTHYYHPKTEWSFLDAVLVRRASIETTGWRVDPNSVKVPNESKYQVNKFGSTARFNANSPFGVSDHWPMYLEIVKPATKAPTPAN